MKILLVAATKGEISPLLEALSWTASSDFSGYQLQKDSTSFDLLITGIGGTATAFAMGGIRTSYDLAINLGVAGSFREHIPIGSLVRVTEDCFADLGAEDDTKFIDLFEMGLQDPQTHPFKAGKLKESLPEALQQNTAIQSLPTARGISVNKVHGAVDSIAQIVQRFNPEVESMEGAAFFYSCHLLNLPCLQIRSISNRVEKRNRASWKLGEAIAKLNSFTIDLLDSLPGKR